jgi:hypothetical protein
MTLRLVRSNDGRNVGTRIQIACYDKLIAEVIVENSRIADTLWAKWANGRYKRKQPMGCCVMNRADIKRLWDVPVGSIIPRKTEGVK